MNIKHQPIQLLVILLLMLMLLSQSTIMVMWSFDKGTKLENILKLP